MTIDAKQWLINSVLDQIAKDVHDGYFDTIEELIKDIPEDKLRGFLPENYFYEQDE